MIKSRLGSEDRILWERVARTASPLSSAARNHPEIEDAEEQQALFLENVTSLVASVSVSAEHKPAVIKPKSLGKPDLRPLDPPTHRKIAKGRIDIEARIDLHGLRQDEAYELLYIFLSRAHARGLRHVMVITGKGRSMGSDGVLKQVVPHWFSTPLFRLLVSAYHDAAYHHGGHGALYVRLRRK